MLHQIKRCSAPCVGPDLRRRTTASWWTRRTSSCAASRDAVRARLAKEMNAAAEAMEFERAARVRDRIRALSAINAEQGINPEGVEEADVFAVHSEGGQACVQVFFFRAGQNWGNRAYFPRVTSSGEEGDDTDAARDPRRLPGPVLRGQADPAPVLLSTRRAQPRAAGRGASLQGRAQGRDRRPQAGGEEAAGRPRAHQRARGAGPQHGGGRRAGQTARRGVRSLQLEASPSASRSTTTATSWARTPSAA